jgi:carbohydrate kinase (thermoresistant glucokinase family)
MDRQGAHNRPMVIIVMGVSSSGKTTVAKLLAETLGWQYQEGDALHPPENVAKMSSGTPLTDADRWPWLHAIAERIDTWRRRGESGVVTCSALKRAYRDILIGDRPDVGLVYLKGSHDLIAARMARRKGHFMPPSLLDNQFATLEEPSADERPIVVDVGETPFRIVEEIMRRLAAGTDSLTSVAPER